MNLLDSRLAVFFKDWIAYKNRVLADGGTLRSDANTRDYYNLLKQNGIAQPVFSWFGEAGIKERVSGVNEYASKLYSLNTPATNYGPELAVNGDFSNGTSNWSNGSLSTISISNNSLLITLSGGDNFGNANQGIQLSAGKVYQLSGKILATSGAVYLAFATSNTSSRDGLVMTTSVPGTLSGSFTPLTTGTWYIRLDVNNVNGTALFDDISVKEVFFDGLPTDAIQSTANSQPAIGGNIAPNEKLCLKNVNGDSRYLTHPTIIFGAAEKWTISTLLNFNGKNIPSTLDATVGIYGGDTSFRSTLHLDPGGALAMFKNNISSSGVAWSLSGSRRIAGKYNLLTLVAYGNDTIELFLNGVSLGLNNLNTEISVNTILRGYMPNSNYIFTGTVLAHIIRDSALSTSQIKTEYNYLRSLYPEIPSTTIGTQTWATSNFEAVCTPQGNLIAEVQPNANVEKMPVLDLTTWLNGSNVTAKTTNSFTVSSTGGIYKASIMTQQKWYKIVVVGNSSSLLTIRDGGGQFVANIGTGELNNTVYFKWGVSASNDLYLGLWSVSGGSTTITSFSLQEIGWAGSQELYDGIYAATAGTVEQKTYAAVKAASMWSHYNNDVVLGAVYGKLYNWFAVKLLQMDIDYFNVANPTTPWGFKVSSNADWNTCIANLGGSTVAGGKMKVAGTAYFNAPNTGADNSSGFSALGSGLRAADGVFTLINVENRFHTIESSTINMTSTLNNIAMNDSPSKVVGRSLRLIKA
jgi:uncharacterized protein (TIGR02145 family)